GPEEGVGLCCWLTEFVEAVGEVGILGGAARVDDLPKGRCLGWWCFRIEVGDIALEEVGGDVLGSFRCVPAVHRRPKVRLIVVLGAIGPGDEVAPVVSGEVYAVLVVCGDDYSADVGNIMLAD